MTPKAQSTVKIIPLFYGCITSPDSLQSDTKTFHTSFFLTLFGRQEKDFCKLNLRLSIDLEQTEM